MWISKGSAAEVQSLCYAGLDQKYLTKETMEAIYGQTEKVASLISGMIKYLRKSSPKKKANKTQRRNDTTTQ
ncbi:MAG: four helix bundle protein [Desulfobacterales bacterium]|nr:four helix bundle protein [Desulfobacterales bacterium]